MVFSVDGVEHYTYNPATKDANTWPFDADQYLLLNIAIEPAIDPAFVSSAMEIDYVRVYQKEESIVTDPLVSAPVPTINESNVVSVFSETYVTNTVTNIFNPDFSGNGVTVSTSIDLESDGNLTGKLENLGYYGARWDALDVSAYSYVHLDYWATTSTEFNFFLIDKTAGFDGGESQEPRYKIAMTGGDETLVQGEWKSVFIPLQHFLDFDSGAFPYDLNDIYQWKFDGNGTLYFDNIYFSTENGLGTNAFKITDFRVFPNPTLDVWTLKAASQNILSIQLFDILGKSVLSLTPNSGEAKIDGSGLTTGLYFAQIQTSNGIDSVKLIKK